jgi:hypothetical protein
MPPSAPKPMAVDDLTAIRAAEVDQRPPGGRWSDVGQLLGVAGAQGAIIAGLGSGSGTSRRRRSHSA